MNDDRISSMMIFLKREQGFLLVYEKTSWGAIIDTRIMLRDWNRQVRGIPESEIQLHFKK